MVESGGRLSSGGASARRLSRLGQRSAPWSGLLSVEDGAALSTVGLQPVSEVFAAVANSVHVGDFYASGGVRLSDMDVRTITSSTLSGSGSNPPRTVVALRSGYRTVLARLAAEVRAVGGDGAVGVRIDRDGSMKRGMQAWTFRVAGTAVRNVGPSRPQAPFLTTLSGGQVAAALRAGWLPMSVVTCPVMAIRYVEIESRLDRRLRAPNAEITAFTEVVNACRHQAREDFAAAARASRADGAVMSSMTLSFEASRDDPICQATVVVTGTTLARFDNGGRVSTVPLTIMPLNKGVG